MASAIAASAAETSQQQFRRVSDEYLDKVYFPYQPTAGTLAGYHQYDTQLEDFSPKGIAAEAVALKSFETRIAAIPAAGLDQVARGDRELVLGTIRSELLTLETIRPWEKNPDTYSSSISGSIFSLMERKFASPDERLRSVIAREKLALSRLDEARANLKNPPKIYTEIAIEQLPGIVSFFQSDVPQAFADVKDAELKAEFAKSNSAVTAALNSYQSWLKTDVLPHSQGDFRIGADTFQKKLAYDEMVDIPLDKLLEIGWADLRKNQQHFNALAKELEPNKDPREVLEELGSNHPAPGKLLDAFRATFDSLIGFIRTNHIVTIPSDIRPIVEETPPFMRATTFASMDTPGPFEMHATEAYFNVTLPDKDMTPPQVESFMHAFNIGTVISTAVHEAYPGHYIQFLWVPQAPSRVRKLLGATSNAEGWAHYCEQMMLDQGYGQPGAGAKDEREAKFLRLGQLQDALLRNARFIVGIQMHTGKMSFDEAVEFFQKEGYQSKESALVETKRGTSDPTYLYYTLGKLEILKLREDMKKKQGAAFSLEEFHNNFLRQGFPPIKIVREAMLGDESPVL
ncbi:DUF885 domain-containing protein [Terracidiphilus sp.]|jgi:uncharacterized protein (DUF885 family)|uniref:DUF885 domain-containing protein n=1 Tax=Terracidiphilus sp. TaxID=1964191 RepID=UPI003C160AFD